MDHRRRPLHIRIARVVVGATLVLIGLVGVFVPIMPGWLLIVPGLAILAGEYVWARRLLDGARNQLERARSAARKRQSEREAA